ncbi:MAG: DUF1272 domain-containing protein [Bacteroidetes bacterium]|nr:DUF1272 domain-containing protein [Bacteroidota bacterium]
MLDIRPSCEHCDKALPNDSNEAMICTFECTFCADCVNTILQNVCPNCGGGFEKRPTRPSNCLTTNCVTNYPVSTEKKFKPVNMEKFKFVLDTFKSISPNKR